MTNFRGTLFILLAIFLSSISGISIAQNTVLKQVTELREETGIRFSQKVLRASSLGCELALQLKAGLIIGTCYVVDKKTYKAFLKKLYASLEARGWKPSTLNKSLTMDLAWFYKDGVTIEVAGNAGVAETSSQFGFIVSKYQD